MEELRRGSKNYLVLGDTTNAIEVLTAFINEAEKAKAVDPNIGFAGVESRLLLAEIYVYQKKWGLVNTEINAIRPEIKPSWLILAQSRLHYIEGLVDYYHTSYKSAIEKFSDALYKDKNNHDAKYFRAKAYEKAGMKKKYIADLKDLQEDNFKVSKQLYQASLQN